MLAEKKDNDIRKFYSPLTGKVYEIPVTYDSDMFIEKQIEYY